MTSSSVGGTKRWLRAVPLAALLTMVYASSASAILFTFSGNSADPTPLPQKGTALFTTTATSLTIVLTNTVNPLVGISQIFDGIGFTFSTAPTSLTLTSVTAANGVITCISGTSCVPYLLSTPANYGWGVTGTLSSPILAAGTTSYKPYGVVNDNIVASADGLSNSQHNPYLDGPVTFVFSVVGWTGLPAVPTITSATGYFGTRPDTVPGTSTDTSVVIPEPTTLLLLGSGLFGLPLFRRRRGQRG